MTTLAAAEIADALADVEEGETVKLLVTGRVTSDKSIEVESVAVSADATEEPEEEAEEEGAPSKMPPGVVMLIGKSKKG